jgi:hypothetical protein
MPRHPSGPPTTWCRRRKAARRRRRSSPFSLFGLPRYSDGTKKLYSNKCFVPFGCHGFVSVLYAFLICSKKKMTHHNPVPLKSLHIIFERQFELISISIRWCPFFATVYVFWFMREFRHKKYLSARKIQVCLLKRISPVFINSDSFYIWLSTTLPIQSLLMSSVADPGSGMEKKNSDSGSGLNIPDHFSESLLTVFGLNYLNSLMRIRIRNLFNPRSVMDGKIRIRDPG